MRTKAMRVYADDCDFLRKEIKIEFLRVHPRFKKFAITDAILFAKLCEKWRGEW